MYYGESPDPDFRENRSKVKNYFEKGGMRDAEACLSSC
jgi:hypothetical protein